MAEWAQLLAGPPSPPPLESGHWYRVESRTKDGVVRVLGPNAVGQTIHASMVRIVTEEPNTITRVQAGRFQRVVPGQPTAELTYYGVCPRGHRIKKLGIGDSEADCNQCGKRYTVEEEQHL